MRRGGACDAPGSARMRGLPALLGCIAVSTAAAGCGVTSEHANVLNGKKQFVSHCGSCHTLARAGTKGVTGPNLDFAFAQARRDGQKSSTFAGMVHGQIQNPAREPQHDPQTGKQLPLMPANLVKGQAVVDVAAYVGMVAGAGGKDTGALASIGVAKAQGTAKETSAGVLAIPADPNGGLSYTFANAQAKAGKVTVESKNDASTGHDIAIEGNGVNAKGDVVQNGGTSRIQVTLKPGTYTFYCTVAGHRQAGMQGKLTVK
jgi:plastocyanin/mono/diheme cytochrome c family protein